MVTLPAMAIVFTCLLDRQTNGRDMIIGKRLVRLLNHDIIGTEDCHSHDADQQPDRCEVARRCMGGRRLAGCHSLSEPYGGLRSAKLNGR